MWENWVNATSFNEIWRKESFANFRRYVQKAGILDFEVSQRGLSFQIRRQSSIRWQILYCPSSNGLEFSIFLVMFEKCLLPKLNKPSFWKRHYVHFDVLFHMVLISNYSITLIRLNWFFIEKILSRVIFSAKQILSMIRCFLYKQ